MSIKEIIPIIGKVIKWIDDWKSKSNERRLIKIQKLKDKLNDVEKELVQYKNCKNTSDYRNYTKLLGSKWVYERKISDLAR